MSSRIVFPHTSLFPLRPHVTGRARSRVVHRNYAHPQHALLDETPPLVLAPLPAVGTQETEAVPVTRGAGERLVLHHLLPQVLEDRDANQQEEEGDADNHGPVSYTHLTLPTKA